MRWSDGLAIRLPTFIVEALELKEGDKVDVHIAGEGAFSIVHDDHRAQALMRVQELRKELPAGWKFDRDEANAR